MATKITIIGAGPCGILLAYYLLRRGIDRVDIYDRRSAPRLVPFATYRTYPLALCERGLYALRSIRDLEEAVKAEAIAVKESVAHLSKTLFLEWLLRQKVSKVMHRLFPKYFPLFISERASNTLDSYSEILDSARGWIDKVKRENKKVLEKM